MYNRTILVVDDEMDILEMIQSIFIRAGFTNILTAVSGREALKIWSDAQPDMVILDIMMPEIDGLSVLKKIRETSKVPVLLLTARGEVEDTFQLIFQSQHSNNFIHKFLIYGISI